MLYRLPRSNKDTELHNGYFLDKKATKDKVSAFYLSHNGLCSGHAIVIPSIRVFSSRRKMNSNESKPIIAKLMTLRPTSCNKDNYKRAVLALSLIRSFPFSYHSFLPFKQQHFFSFFLIYLSHPSLTQTHTTHALG